MVDQENNEPWVGVDEVSSYLSIKTDTLYKWLEKKLIPAHKIGRIWRFKLSEVDAWVRSNPDMKKINK